MFAKKNRKKVQKFEDSEKRIKTLLDFLTESGFFKLNKKEVSSKSEMGRLISTNFLLKNYFLDVFTNLEIRKLTNESWFAIRFFTSSKSFEFSRYKFLLTNLSEILGEDSNGLVFNENKIPNDALGQISFAWEFDNSGRVIKEYSEDTEGLSIYFNYNEKNCELHISDCQLVMNLEDLSSG